METMKTIAARQSCRSYTGEQITAEQLRTVLEAANAAPVGYGKYGRVKLTVVQSKPLLDKLDVFASEYFNSPDARMLYGAPTCILVSVKYVPEGDNSMACANAACIVQNMLLAATDLNLGSVYLYGIPAALAAHPDCFEEFKIPEEFRPVAAAALGKAGKDPEKRELTTSRIKTDHIA